MKIGLVVLVTTMLMPFLLYGQTIIAVAPLTSGCITKSESQTLTDALRSELGRLGSFKVMERTMMEEILKEQGFALSGACTDTSCAISMGQLLAVQHIILGSVGKVGKTYAVNARMVDVNTGTILRDVIEHHKGEIDGLLTEVVPVIARKLSGKEKKMTSTKVVFEIIERPPPAVEVKLKNRESRFCRESEVNNFFNVESSTLALWTFNEGQGTVVFDKSSKGNDLQVNGRYTWINDSCQGHLRFDETAASAQINQSLYPAQITVEAVVNVTRFPANKHSMIVSATDWDSRTYGYELRVNADGRAEFIVGTNTRGWRSALASSKIPLESEVHLAGTYNGKKLRILIDGKVSGESEYSGGLFVAERAPLKVGRRSLDQPFWFYGEIDEVRISDKDLYNSR